jgi:hypothetical protein
MRPVLLLLLTSISLSVYSQQTSGFLAELGCSPDRQVKACLLVDQNGYGKELLIYRNGKAWDTLSIAREGDSDIGDTCFIQTVQIDQKGFKEVVVSWSGEGSHSYGGSTGGGFSNKFTKHEIWNLNTGKKLFAAQSEYYQEESIGYYIKPDSVLQTQTVICSYQYAFSVTKEGKIKIGNLEEHNAVTDDNGTVNKNACSFSRPDHTPGVYVFRNGQFIKEGKISQKTSTTNY